MSTPDSGDPSLASQNGLPDQEYADARKYLANFFKTRDPQASSCLSVVPHDLKDARDLRAHFFGCLDSKKRIDSLEDAGDDIWKQAKKLENENTDPDLRGTRKSPDLGQVDDEDEDEVDMRYITALNLQAELKRIAVLRRMPALVPLVRELRQCINDWREENRISIAIVGERRINSHAWRVPSPLGAPRSRSKGRPRGPTVSQKQTSSMQRVTAQRPHTAVVESSRPELDAILPEFADKLKQVIEEKSSRANEPEPDDISSASYDLMRDVKARIIKLRRPSAPGSATASVMKPMKENIDNKVFKGTFPDQQISVHHLLSGEFKRDAKMNPVEQSCPSDLRYYHIPANNMIWVEQAIASYFDERVPSPGESFNSSPKTGLVLQDGCWRGQQHSGGPGSVVHTRNLRPLCEKISTDAEDFLQSGENTQKSLVLFMPFLHWETDRRRNQVANLIEQLEDEHDLDERETERMWRAKRKEDRQGINFDKNTPASARSTYKEPDYYRTRGRDRDKMLEALARMLWEKIGDGNGLNKPSGLNHTLWQKIRDEKQGNELVVALRKAIIDGAVESRIPPILEPLVFEPDTKELREWGDVLWEFKKVGKGYPTPHALEDIFWEEIKKARKREEGSDQQCQPGSRGVFQEETHIFQGVELDEYAQLMPTNPLAKVLVRAARLYECITTYPDQRLMEEYLFKYPPLHPRRTLDQAYFWRLRDTRLRDRDQVVYRYTKANFTHKYRQQSPSDPKYDKSSSSATSNKTNGPCHHESEPESWVWTRHGQYEEENGCDQCNEDIRKVSRAIMVDQLWLWCLDKNTILTCFPQRYGMSEKDPSGVHQAIRTRVKTRSNPDNHVRSIFDLALIILDECFDAFFNRTRTADKRPQVMDVFAESIGRVTNKQAIAFKHLWALSERLTEIYQSGVEDRVDPRLILSLLNVTPEAELQREIRDIIDELDIILHIAKQQQEMISRFIRFATQIISADVDKCNRLGKDSPSDQNSSALHILIQQQGAFKNHSDDLQCEIDDRIKELEGLKLSAESTAGNVNDLLGLKQQQASVVQAYEAMKQGGETVRQGKAIMVFTVMTIVFLPLSFTSSLFGMNAAELTSPDGNSSDSTGSAFGEIMNFWPTTFKRQIFIMFTVSLGAVLLVIIPAFSPLIRATYSFVFNQSIAKIIIWTGLYRLWFQKGRKSKDIRDGGRANVSKMKKRVQEDLRRQNLIRSEILDGVRDATENPYASDKTLPRIAAENMIKLGAERRAVAGTNSDLEAGV